MTGSTEAITARQTFRIVEPFRDYKLNWSTVSARTDTPGLIGFFIDAELGHVLVEGYVANRAVAAEVHDDLAAASFRTAPE